MVTSKSSRKLGKKHSYMLTESALAVLVFVGE